ncbi:MAG: GNAT family N-acetyltransferase [Thermoleophilia bacterium]
MSLRLETPRLIVRDYTAADLDDVAEILADPEVFWWVKEPFTRKRARLWLDEEMGYVARDGTGRRAVVLRTTGKVIGGAGLVWRDLESGRELELGYHLHHGYWGRGFATEAGAVCLEYARSLGLRRVISLIYVDNPRSEAVARRLGMSPDGELVWAGLPHRRWTIELGASGATVCRGAPPSGFSRLPRGR